MSLNGTKTHENLKEAFAGESQANRRYLWFAQKADVEGYPDAAALFRSVAEGETGHAHGHLEYLAEVGDPATGEPIGDTEDNFKSAVAGETYEYTQMYPGFAKTARDEASTRSPTGSRPRPAPRRATPAASPRASKRSDALTWPLLLAAWATIAPGNRPAARGSPPSPTLWTPGRLDVTTIYDPKHPLYLDEADVRATSSPGCTTCATAAGCASSSARRSPRCSR
jgi:rubrerythrin